MRPSPLAAFLTSLSLALSAGGCGSGKKIPGLENFRADVVKQNLYVSFLSTTFETDAGGSFPIPGLPGATLGFSPNLSGDGTVFQVTIPFMSVLDGGKPALLQGLPDGRALPGIRDGVMPRWTEHFSGLDMSFYLSQEAFAFFIPIQLRAKNGTTLPFLVSVKIQDERGNRIGQAYAIPPNPRGEGAGIFILLPYLGSAAQGGIAVRQAP
jgi:hypothetical protein